MESMPPPPSSRSDGQWIYDVFINFRMEDTGNTFVPLLRAALLNVGINTYNDENIEKGMKLEQELMQAIQVSQVSLVILSKNYASSTLCLRELVMILHCNRVFGNIVVPIFFDVDPSEMRKLRGIYERDLAIHETRWKDDSEKMVEVKKWREALIQVTDFPGWNYRFNCSNESTIVKQIVEAISTKLDRKYLSIKNFSVGLKSREDQWTHGQSSSKSKPHWIHDVFINFRGEDTRKNFVSHLHAALSNAGINTFLDDETLERGSELGPALMRAIEGSQFLLVVLSENYASSTWCLRELVKILDCNQVSGNLVVPIFYDVDPSELRKQIGDYKKHFDEYEKRFKDDLQKIEEMKRWREALTQVANYSGWVVRNRDESTVVEHIVDDILKRVNRKYLPIPDFPIGLESRAKQMTHFLRKKTTGICIVGIWGMGGIGKSTIAKVIYNELLHEFEEQSFLANIREVWERDRGQIDLQEQLLSDIHKTRKKKVHSIEWGKALINERLCTKKTLVVLDDVNELEQLNALCGNRNGIGPGSIIIITTRDARILNVLEVDRVYKVEELNDTESLELFSWHAFREASPREGFLSLSREVVANCGRLPLALEVLGRHLYKRGKEE